MSAAPAGGRPTNTAPYWDGTETRLWYAGGKLYRIEDPGTEITDIGGLDR